MTVYFDSSVVLRKVLGQEGCLAEWDAQSRGCSSALTRLECARTLDRARLTGTWSAETLFEYQSAVDRLLGSFDELEISSTVLARARLPLTMPLTTLDALHLSSALLWHELHPNTKFSLATHDRALGRAARIMGLTVIGID